MTQTKTKHEGCKLTTHDLNRLDTACDLIARAFNHPYLVGSATQKATYRDVDVRLILDDDVFDTLCPNRQRWELLSLSLGDFLRTRTHLTIDFQIQRQTEANQRHNGMRNPLGCKRTLAAGGDATPWTNDPHDDENP